MMIKTYKREPKLYKFAKKNAYAYLSLCVHTVVVMTLRILPSEYLIG